MVEETQEPAPDAEQPRRVVRRVVRRTVAAPPPPVATPREPAPEPVAERDPDRTPDPSRPASHRARPSFALRAPQLPRIGWPSRASSGLDDEDRADEVATVATTTREPTVDGPSASDEPVAAPAGPSWRERTSDVLGRGRTALGATVGALGERAAALPLPAAAAIVGGATGLAAALVCWVAILVFSAVLGTPAGGRWGFAVLVLVGIGAVLGARRALDSLDAPDPTATSLVGVLLVPVVVLAFFLGPSTTGWAFLIVPVLTALTFAVAQPAVARLSTTPQEG